MNLLPSQVTSCVVIVLLAGFAPAQEHAVYIGTAETTITPERPVALEGAFALRVSDGIESPITANVLIIETRHDDETIQQSVIISADLVHLPMEMIHGVRRKVQQAIPELDVDKIFISVTHTHQAPVVMRGNFIIPDGVMTIGEYIDFFVERVASAVVKAHTNLARGSVAWGLGSAMVSYNRVAAYLDGSSQIYAPTRRANYKGPGGPEYQHIPTLFFFDDHGKLLATTINVWSPSQEYFGSTKISADFWHYARTRLKKEFGQQLVVIGLCGAAGDTGPWRRVHVDAEDRMRKLRGIESWLDEFGRRIAESVIDTYKLVNTERHAKIKHRHVRDVVPLPGWKLNEDEINAIRTLRDAYARDLAEHPEKAAALARPISWRTQTLERQAEFAKRQDGAYDSEIHVLRLGDVAICTNQFELYTEYGLRILGRSKAHMTCVVQLTGPAYYLPTVEAVQGGGYGAVPESCAVGPDGGNALVDVTVKHINELFNNLKVTLPDAAKLVDGKPIGDGWKNLLDNPKEWEFESEYWRLKAGTLHGESQGGLHHFAWTKRQFSDFSLHAVVRLQGGNPNSGLGIRLHPKSANDVPGYQVDMGQGFWGNLWDENANSEVQIFPPDDAAELVHSNDWNHFYVEARGHHIKVWLNGVKTVDTVHNEGFDSGAIGLELCHGPRHTILDVKLLSIREHK